MNYRWLAVFIFFLVSCGSNTKKSPKQLSIVSHIGHSPEDLHPINGNSAPRLELFHYMHTSLAKDDIVNQKMAPDALVRIPEYNSAERKYECELRDFMTFDDGSPVTTSDVLFSLKLQVCPNMLNGSRKHNFENINDIEVKDDKHFDFMCRRPNVEDVSMWSQYPILQQSVFDSAGIFNAVTFEELKADTNIPDAVTQWVEEFNKPIYGSELKWLQGMGPYKISAWTENEVILRKKANHWSEKSPLDLHRCYADQLIFKVNQDPNAKYLDVKNQLVDVSSGFSSIQMSKLMEDTSISNNYNAYYVSQYSFTLITLNLRPEVVNRAPIFSDKLVRQAFAHALPIQDAIDKLSNGTASRIASPVSINKPEHNDNLKPYEYDVARSIALLKEAGWSDSDGDGIMDKMIDGNKQDLKITLTIPPFPVVESISKIMLEGLRQAGFSASVDKPADWKTRLEDTHDFDCLLHCISSSFGPVYPLGLYDSESYPVGINFSGYSNPVIDSLRADISRSMNYDERKELLDRFQEIVYDDLPYAYLTTGKRGLFVNKRLGTVSPSGALPTLFLNTIELAGQDPTH